MATKKTQELLQESEKQAESVYASLGRLLYENIQAGAISYSFTSPDTALTAKAKRLLRDIVAEKISDRRTKRAPLLRPPPAKAPVKAPVRPSVEIPPRKAPKNKVVAVLKGVGHVLSDLSAAAAPAPANAPKPAVSRRGQLDPYTKLIVTGQVCANKIIDVQKDFNDCLSAGLLHTTGERTAVFQAAADEKIQSIISLMAHRREEIKSVMEQKRQFFAENPEAPIWKAEENFLKHVEQEIDETTRHIDRLVDEVVGLFKNINDVFEKDLEHARLSREARAALAQEPEEAPQEEPLLPDPVSDEPEPSVEEEGLVAEVATEEAFAAESEETSSEEAGDYGLFETAARKLGRESISDEEKLAVLHTLFRNAPKRAVPFFYELTREADIFFQRKLFSLLNTLDYPTLVDLYRRFVTDEHSSLRLQGIMGLVKLGSSEARNVIVTAIRDRDANVRRFIVNHLDHNGGEAEETAIAHLAGDSDDSVSRIAIRKLGLMANHFAFVSLVPKLESSNVKVCKEAIDALVRMIGVDLDYDYTAPELERKRQARAWKSLAQESYTNPRLVRELRQEYLQGARVSRSSADAKKSRRS